MTAADFIAQLRQRFEGFDPEHTEIEHVALGAFCQWLKQRRDTDRSAFFHETFPAVCEFLEPHASEPAIADLLQTSFLENLHIFGEDCALLRPIFGPRLEGLAREYEERWGVICGQL